MIIGAIIIGDEILSGKRQDKHFDKAIELLKARGLSLDWVRYLGDDLSRLTEAFAASFAAGDIVFSFGGIGVTPDDRTRQAVAAALGLELVLHPEAEREIRQCFGHDAARLAHESSPQDGRSPSCGAEDSLLRKRLMLGEFPAGSAIVPNPYNRIPGFSIRQHYFFPGFPVMAWPMLEWVLDTQLAHLHHAVPRAEQSIIVFEAPESGLLDLMNRITRDYPHASLFSLPSVGDEVMRRHIELGMRGEPQSVRQAMAEICAEMTRLGYEWQDREV